MWFWAREMDSPKGGGEKPILIQHTALLYVTGTVVASTKKRENKGQHLLITLPLWGGEKSHINTSTFFI